MFTRDEVLRILTNALHEIALGVPEKNGLTAQEYARQLLAEIAINDAQLAFGLPPALIGEPGPSTYVHCLEQAQDFAGKDKYGQ